MFEHLVDLLGKEWAVISQSPVSFITVIFIVAGIVWAALRWQYETRITHRDDEIAAYKRKLDGATPDEARANLNRLEE